VVKLEEKEEENKQITREKQKIRDKSRKYGNEVFV
jgi:hypothetical protein